MPNIVRIIVRTEDREAAANVSGANSDVSFKTFDIDNQQLWHALIKNPKNGFLHVQVVGAEVL